MVRMTFTLPPQLREDISYLAGRLGVTRSALVGQLMGESMADLRRLVEQIPDNPSDVDIRRFRGSSEELVSQRVGSLRRMGDDLFGVR